MLVKSLSQMKNAFLFVLIFIFLTGVAYPLLITALSTLIFPHQANGSLIMQNGKIIGSDLIGQNFAAEKYFWGRPSATQPFPYNAANSSGSNLAPSNPLLLETIKQRIDILTKANKFSEYPVSIELVTSSASGLDPDISFQGALFQVARVAKARKIPENVVTNLVKKYSTISPWHLLGTARVNVLHLNLQLDKISKGMNPDE